MSNFTKATINIDGFGAVVTALSRMSGKDFEVVVKAEVGHVFKGAIQMLPTSMAKKIVRRTMPEGYKYKGGTGNRKVTRIASMTRNFHAGQLRKAGTGPRGGQKYEFPKKAWMNSKAPAGVGSGGWEAFVNLQKKKTNERIANIGTTAGIIYYMGKKGNIKFPGTVKGEKKIVKGNARKNVINKVAGRGQGKQREYVFTAESDGLKMAGVNGIQKVLNIATGKRAKFFVDNVNKGFINDIKKFMPKNYPLIFQ